MGGKAYRGVLLVSYDQVTVTVSGGRMRWLLIDQANCQMDEVLTRTGWPRKELARRINQRARTRGVHLNNDASRLRNWLLGQQP